MATTDKIRRDIEKTKEKISELQKKLRSLEAQLVEEENLEIVRMVKAVKMDNRELTAILKAYASGLITLPEDMLAEASGADLEGTSDDMEGYADEDCTELITNEGNFVPQKPDGGWVDGTTFYAKFSRKTCDITVKKMVAGGLGDRSREFDFSYSYTDPENDQTVTGNFKLKHEGTTTISDVPVGVSLTVTERNLDYRVSAKYGSDAVSISYTDKEDNTNSLLLSPSPPATIFFTVISQVARTNFA